MTAKQRATRAGFTLVEILMVIAIIGILAALLITAIGRVRDTAKVLSTQNDIGQLEVAVGKFKEQFGLLPPSHLLKPTPIPNGTGPAVPARFAMPVDIATPEGQLLQRMFPRWAPPLVANSSTGALTAINFDPALPVGTRVPDDYRALVRLTNPYSQSYGNPSAGVVAPIASATAPLDGNQLLVLLLGGPQAVLSTEAIALLAGNPAVSAASYSGGWDVAGPYAPSNSTTSKKAPAYDFPAARLSSEAAGRVPCPNGIPRVTDAWGTPFAYFTASAGDSYDPRVQFPFLTDLDPTSATLNGTYDGAVATNLANDLNNSTVVKVSTFTAHPYGSNGKWLSPGKFQIISAGRDKLFGPGSFLQRGGPPGQLPTHVWDAKNPQGGTTSAVYYGEGGGSATDPNSLARGADDQSNFNGGSNLGTSNAP